MRLVSVSHKNDINGAKLHIPALNDRGRQSEVVYSRKSPLATFGEGKKDTRKESDEGLDGFRVIVGNQGGSIRGVTRVDKRDGCMKMVRWVPFFPPQYFRAVAIHRQWLLWRYSLYMRTTGSIFFLLSHSQRRLVRTVSPHRTLPWALGSSAKESQGRKKI